MRLPKKEVSTNLFRYIRQIDIKFNPFDARSAAVREVFRQVQATRFREANPRLKIEHEIHSRADVPTARFVFADDSEQIFDAPEEQAHDVLFHVHMKAMEVEAEFELAGKSVETTNN